MSEINNAAEPTGVVYWAKGEEDAEKFATAYMDAIELINRQNDEFASVEAFPQLSDSNYMAVPCYVVYDADFD